MSRIHPVSGATATAEWEADGRTESALAELLALLPEDVGQELNAGQIDIHDPGFLDGLTDHVTRLSIASPSQGKKVLGKLIRLKKEIARSLRDGGAPEESTTVTRSSVRVGRNNPCPCGSGRKFKQCCLRHS